MEAALLGLLGVALAAVVGLVEIQLVRITSRLDTLTDQIGGLRADVAAVSTKLDAHLADRAAH